MERVQFQQEQMLAELKDLVEKGLFSQTEIKQIMRKRTAFETALVRRIAKKADFLRYAAYEMSLEALRRKRVERLKLPRSVRSISDYALVRRQFHIFERALKKFKGDVGLWIQYLQVADREGARALVGRISARALQLHPNSPPLYILAASHELKNHSPSSARTLLQRGIRLNPESVDLWREYVTMELGFVESLRRRWKILGLVENTEDNTQQNISNNRSTLSDVLENNGQDEINLNTDPDISTTNFDEGEEARKDIMQGALIKAVISNAVKALPKITLFQALHNLLMAYPCPQSLRRLLLDHLHTHLQSSFSVHIDSEAARLHAIRYLTPDLEGLTLIDVLRQANEDLLGAVRLSLNNDCSGDEKYHVANNMAKTYASFVREWTIKEIDENLKLYLLSSLQQLASLSPPLPSVLAAHLELLNHSTPSPPSISKLLKLAKKYTLKAPSSAELWLARLRLEKLHTEGNNWRDVWEEAKRSIGSNIADSEDAENVWLWGVQIIDDDYDNYEEGQNVYETLLKETMTDATLKTLHKKLLIRYMAFLHRRRSLRYSHPSKFFYESENDVKEMAKNYFPTAEVWECTFELFAKLTGPTAPNFLLSAEGIHDMCYRLLQHIYEIWRGLSTESHRNAAIAFGSWLLYHGKGKGKEAAMVIERARVASSANAEELAAFESQWRTVISTDDKELEVEQSDVETDMMIS